jgi:hypothetical protein
VRDNDGNPLVGAYHGGVFLSDGTTTAGLGPGNSWNEWRPGGETELVQDYDLSDVALCRDDSLAIFADRTDCRLMVYDRARALDLAAVKAADHYFPVETGNTLMRLFRSVPLPAAPLRVAPMPDGSAAWVILDTEPERQVICVSLAESGEMNGARGILLPPDCRPEDLAVSPSGILAVVDSGPGKNIRMFDATSGKSRGAMGGVGGMLAGGFRGQVRAAGTFYAPRAVAIDGNGFLYVLDSLADGLTPRITCHAPSRGGWDARTALWTMTGMVIGAAAVLDQTDPGRILTRGLEGRADLSEGETFGRWTPKRLTAPFGQEAWKSLPDDLPESQIPPQETGVVSIGGKRFAVHHDNAGRFALTTGE